MNVAGYRQRLSDEVHLEGLLARYCYAVDLKDWGAYRETFTDDGHVDYSAAGLFTGGIDDAVEYLEQQQASLSVGMHYLTNVEATISGDSAHVVAMWFNAVRLPGASDMTFFHGRWHDEVVRTAVGWRIRELRLEVVR
ncbi:hypothetical protein FIV07_10910 [Mycobacterium sp. THAF192]|nr:hypothetical protein FIV07_10910 [Mycobacterium sp. THAF192]